MKKIFKGKKKIITIPLFIALVLFFLPFSIGLGISWLVYKKIKNTKIRNLILVFVALPTLFIGIIWVIAIFSPTKIEQKTIEANKDVSVEKITSDIIESNLSPTTIITPTIIVTPTLIINKVVKIIDGDTIDVSINGKTERIRLIGVDTPETVDPRKSVQCFGKEASAKTKELIEGKNVILESDYSQGDKDKYNRLLRYVSLIDGTLINKKLIEDGFGFEYTYNIPYKYQKEFKEAQKQAENNKRGLWADNVCPIITIIPTIKITLAPTIKPTSVPIVKPTSIPVVIKTPTTNTSYNCDCSKACTVISSCDEAQYLLNVCGCSARDGDKDGIACDGAPLNCQN